MISQTINSPNSPSPGSAGGVISALRPEEIVDSHSIVAIPAVLGASLAVGAALALGTTLVASVRRRRRDSGRPEDVGALRTTTRTLVAWQSSVTVAVGTVIGVPLGIILGHVLWNGFAEAIHAVPVDERSRRRTSLRSPWARSCWRTWLRPFRRGSPRRTPTAVLLRAE